MGDQSIFCGTRLAQPSPVCLSSKACCPIGCSWPSSYLIGWSWSSSYLIGCSWSSLYLIGHSWWLSCTVGSSRRRKQNPDNNNENQISTVCTLLETFWRFPQHTVRKVLADCPVGWKMEIFLIGQNRSTKGQVWFSCRSPNPNFRRARKVFIFKSFSGGPNINIFWWKLARSFLVH